MGDGIIYSLWVFMYNIMPFRLLIGGAVLLIFGVVKRVNDKGAPRLRGLSLIVMGAIVLLPNGIICGERCVKAISLAADNYNDLYYQFHNGKARDLERVLKGGSDVEGAGLPWERPARDGERTLLGIVSDYSTVMPHGTEKAALLIEYGADVNRVMCQRCEYGHPNGEHKRLCSATPVLFAADNPNYDLLKLLIDNGGDVNATDYDGITALDIVEKNINDTKYIRSDDIKAFEQMRELLIENGAKNGNKGAEE